MVTALTATAAALAFVGETALIGAILALHRQARHADDERPARLLLIAVPFLVIALLLRGVRYLVGGPGAAIETTINVGFHATAFALVWRALVAMPGEAGRANVAGWILVATGAASALLLLPVALDLAYIILLIGLEMGYLAAALATVGWRLRLAGRAGWPATLAIAAGFSLIVVAWMRALIFVAAANGDQQLFFTSRLLHAAGIFLAALVAWPGIATLVEHLTPTREEAGSAPAAAEPTRDA